MANWRNWYLTRVIGTVAANWRSWELTRVIGTIAAAVLYGGSNALPAQWQGFAREGATLVLGWLHIPRPGDVKAGGP